MKSPELYVRPVAYRPMRIYLGGEVRRPGHYTLSGTQDFDSELSKSNLQPEVSTGSAALGATTTKRTSLANGSSNGALFPDVFDAIRSAQGITPFSDLAAVQVTRQQVVSSGGGRIRTNLNFLSLITEGNESQNIPLFDGDLVSVGKSDVVLREQLLKAGQTNLSPQFIQVYVSGRVVTPGVVTLPQGSAVNQAINLASGPRLLKARWNSSASPARARWTGASSATTPTPPALATTTRSSFSAGIGLLNEVATPSVGV